MVCPMQRGDADTPASGRCDSCDSGVRFRGRLLAGPVACPVPAAGDSALTAVIMLISFYVIPLVLRLGGSPEGPCVADGARSCDGKPLQRRTGGHGHGGAGAATGVFVCGRRRQPGRVGPVAGAGRRDSRRFFGGRTGFAVPHRAPGRRPAAGTQAMSRTGTLMDTGHGGRGRLAPCNLTGVLDPGAPDGEGRCVAIRGRDPGMARPGP